MTDKGIRATQITADEVQKNPDIYDQVRDGKFQIVYASPEIILGDGVEFTNRVARAKKCRFFSDLVCIVIDEAHVAWAWQSFRYEYCHLATLRSYLPKVPFLLLSATLALNVLGYLHATLHLHQRTKIYRVSIDRPNITSIVSTIRTPGFSALEWLAPAAGRASEIPKTMVFTDNINESQELVTYIRRKLPLHLQRNDRDRATVRAYSASLTWNARVQNLAAFRLGDARILVCTDAAGLGVDISDVEIVVQWRISRQLSLAGLIQRIGRAGRDPSIHAVAVIMTERQYLLPKDMTPEHEFAGLSSSVSPETEEETKRIIGELYFGRLASRATKSSSAHGRIDPALLWM